MEEMLDAEVTAGAAPHETGTTNPVDMPGGVYLGRTGQSQGMDHWFGPHDPITGAKIPDTAPIADRKVYNAIEIARIVWAVRQIRENVAGSFDRKDWSEISDERADAHVQEIKEALRMYGAAGVEAREFTLAWSGE